MLSITRTELMDFAYDLYNRKYGSPTNERKVNYCKAKIIDYNGGKISLLVSYFTIVGIYKEDIGSLYIFDYFSSTTYRHIYKAAKLLGATRIFWLYRRSDGIVETDIANYANTYYCTKKDFCLLTKYDFSQLCGGKHLWIDQLCK